LRADLEDDTSGNFRKGLVGLVTPLAQAKAEYLHNAIAGAGTDEGALIDVLTQVTNKELNEIKYDYELHWGEGKSSKSSTRDELAKPAGQSQLEKDIAGDTSFNFKKTLLHLAQANRQEFLPGEGIEHHLIESDAQAIFKAGEDKFGTDDNTFIEILTSRSPWHIQEVDKIYVAKHGHGLAQAIRKETSGDYMRTLLALVQTPDAYWAHRLHQAIAGLGTNDKLLVFIMVTHDKNSLHTVGKTYATLYNETLEKAIEGDTSGDYKRLMLEILH